MCRLCSGTILLHDGLQYRRSLLAYHTSRCDRLSTSIITLTYSFLASAGFIVSYVGLRVIIVTSTHPDPMGLDPISSRPTTIGSFVQRAPGDPAPTTGEFWTVRVGTGKNQPKDLFQQSLPRSAGKMYWQGRDVPV